VDLLDRERWARVDALFDAALDRPAEEREAWLAGECAGDDELRRKVLRLLALATGEGGLEPEGAMEGPVWAQVAEDLHSTADHASDLAEGRAIGPYRVVGLIGSGGMGRVYEAEDPRLGRRVALKVLHPERDDAERRRRFEREARAIASLSHPSIVHVYAIDEADGLIYIAMERVAGRTLGELIPADGMPLAQILDLAVPLADALAAAHASGVVHRDLKPANVMVDPEGRVKVLDFGLAKWVRGGDVLASAVSDVTREGRVVGTVSHMSPEQAEGREIDHRTDLFALGVTLFEMCTGRLPFPGSSAASVITAIIRDTPPPVTELNPRLPEELARLVKRLLAKDPERRCQSAADVRSELAELRDRLVSGELRALSRRRARGPLWAAALVAVAAFATALFLSRDGGRGSAAALQGSFDVLTTGVGPELGPSLSPDGRFVVYSARPAGNWDVFLLRVGGERPMSLTGDSESDDLQPVFSPDGEQVAFRSARSGGGLFLMGATGESVRRLADFGWNPSWSPDGREVAFATLPVFHSPFDRPAKSELWAVEVASGRTRRISPGDAVQPSWSPGGHRIAYWGLPDGSSQRDIWTVPARGGEPVAVTRDEAVDWNPVWSPDGAWLYFSSNRGGSMNLWRVAIDERSGAVTGEPERVTTPATYAHDLAFSRDGNRLVYVSTLVEQELLRIPFDPATGRNTGPAEPVIRDLRGASFPQVSPDGRWLVYTRSQQQEDVVLSTLDGGEQRTLTDDPARDRFARWSPDGERVAFYSDRDGGYEVWIVDRDGSGLRRVTHDPEQGSARFGIWSPDGKRLLFSRRQVTGLIVDPETGPDAPTIDELPPLDPDGGDFFVAMAWSPDGRRIAGTVRAPDGRRAGIVLFDLETRRYERLLDYGVWPSWLPDGRRLLFHAAPRSDASSGDGYPPGDHLFVVDRETREVAELVGEPGASLDEATVSFDGRWIVCVRTSVRADIWTLARDES